MLVAYGSWQLALKDGWGGCMTKTRLTSRRCKTAARAIAGHLFICDDHGTLRLCLATDLAGAQGVSFSAFCQAIQSMNRWN